MRHDSLVNQLSSPQILATRPDAILSGLGIIMIGLFKKVVIADGAAQFVDPVFFASEQGVSIGLAHAWLATALFAFVIYFDFSGYSDIAIGLARLFNVRFPENFASPYKAPNIADFWRRWHITLSQFLQHYLYVPLGGNRRGPARQTANMAITMLLGGLWHGAGWNFVIWGGLHGAYLAIYRAWNLLRPNGARPNTSLLRVVGARSLTFLAVVVAWVFFRATSLESALNILAGMVGLNGWTTTIDLPAGPIGNGFVTGVALALILLIGVNVLPTTQEYMARFRPTIRMYRGTRGWSLPLLRFAPTAGHVSALTALGLIAVSHLDRVQAFIYFRL